MRPFQRNPFARIIWVVLASAFLLPYGAFLSTLWKVWRGDPQFSYGMIVPVIVGYLIWTRRAQLRAQVGAGRNAGLAVVLVGCWLQVLGSLSGVLLISGVALVVALMGTILYLWGPNHLRIVAAPVALLTLMVPLPSYTVGELSWYLQRAASTISSVVLRFLGVPVYQDGNLLRLANYVLEVKQACSGSRSFFSLLTLALVLSFSVKRKWWMRILLIAATPLLAVGANLVRIVGTGIIALHWGQVAANESLHAAWGVLVFVIAVLGLLGVKRLLQWAANGNA